MKNKSTSPSMHGTAKTEVANRKGFAIARNQQSEVGERLDRLDEMLYEYYSVVEKLPKKRRQSKEVKMLDKEAGQLEELIGKETDRTGKLDKRFEGAVSEEEWKSIIADYEKIQEGLNCLEEDYTSFEEDLEAIKEKQE